MHPQNASSGAFPFGALSSSYTSLNNPASCMGGNATPGLTEGGFSARIAFAVVIALGVFIAASYGA